MIRYDIDYGFSGFDYTNWDNYGCPFDKFLALTQDLEYFKSIGYNEYDISDKLGISVRMFRFIKRRRVKDLKLAVAEMCVDMYHQGYSKREISRILSDSYSDIGYSISPQSVVNYIREYPYLVSAYERERRGLDMNIFDFTSVQKNLLVL